jgi:hypothetical protein
MYGEIKSNATCNQLGGGGGSDDAPDLLKRRVLQDRNSHLCSTIQECMTKRTYLWSLLCANLFDNELLVRGNVSEELGNGPVITDPQLVCGPSDESLVVRNTVWSAENPILKAND